MCKRPNSISRGISTWWSHLKQLFVWLKRDCCSSQAHFTFYIRWVLMHMQICTYTHTHASYKSSRNANKTPILCTESDSWGPAAHRAKRQHIYFYPTFWQCTICSKHFNYGMVVRAIEGDQHPTRKCRCLSMRWNMIQVATWNWIKAYSPEGPNRMHLSFTWVITFSGRCEHLSMHNILDIVEVTNPKYFDLMSINK